MIFAGGKVITFTKGEYETTDKTEIEAIKKAKSVEEVKVKAQSKKAD